MAKKINQKQLENMIAECVGQVLTESRQSRQKTTNSKIMNEAQLARYIQNIINEEMEKEGLVDFAKGMGGYLGRKAKEAANATGQAVRNGVQNAGDAIGNAGQAVRNGVQKAGDAIQGATQNVQQFGQEAMQAGKNASAAADTQKLVKQIDGLYQKYGNTLTKSQLGSIRSAKSALKQLAQAFGNGNVDA